MIKKFHFFIYSITILLFYSYVTFAEAGLSWIPFIIFLNLSDIRIIIFLPVITMVFFLLNRGKKIKLDATFFFTFIMFLYSLSVNIIANSFDYTLSLLIFLLFFCWPYLLTKHQINMVNLMFALRVYLYAVMLTAIGVFIQLLLDRFLGIQFFRVIQFSTRTAFSFLWMDFSFLSLYLSSAVPLLFLSFKGKKRFVFSGFLLTASLATSARTGVTAFIFIFILYTIFYRKNIKDIVYSLAAFPLILYFIYKIYLFLSVRGVENIANDNGRFSNYLVGYNFWLNNMMYGNFLDPKSYSDNIFMLPHNFFIYFLALGGIVFILIFIAWFISMLPIFRKSHDMIKFSILIALFGFNFIPSFFSGYFFGFLLSLALFYSKIEKYERGL